MNSTKYTDDYSLVPVEFDRIEDWTHKTFLVNFKTKTAPTTSKKVVILTGIVDTSPNGVSVATERATRSAGGGARGQRPAPPRYYLINSPPLVSSASR